MDRPDGFYVIALGGRDDLEKAVARSTSRSTASGSCYDLLWAGIWQRNLPGPLFTEGAWSM
jgi:hypothetical protein